MRRTASSVLRDLEIRVARLEKQSKEVSVGGKIGFLSPNGRYSYSLVEKIVGDTVHLNKGGWNQYTMSLRDIIKFSQELSKEWDNKYLIKIR